MVCGLKHPDSGGLSNPIFGQVKRYKLSPARCTLHSFNTILLVDRSTSSLLHELKSQLFFVSLTLRFLPDLYPR